MNTVDVIQGSNDWHKERTGRITGSRVGAILGHSPWQKPDDVLREMVRQHHGFQSEFEGNVATDHGTKFESVALLEYSLETGRELTQPGMWIGDDDRYGYSPDAVADEEILVDAKAPYSGKIPDSAPDHYVDQLQWGMYISGLEVAHLWYWTENDTELFVIPKSESWLADNLPKIEEFYSRYESELDNAAHLEPLVAHREDEAWVSAAGAYRAAETRLKQAQAALAEAKEHLLSLCDKDSEGAGIEAKKITRKGNVQYAKIPELGGVDLEQYRAKSSSYWKISVKDACVDHSRIPGRQLIK